MSAGGITKGDYSGSRFDLLGEFDDVDEEEDPENVLASGLNRIQDKGLPVIFHTNSKERHVRGKKTRRNKEKVKDIYTEEAPTGHDNRIRSSGASMRGRGTFRRSRGGANYNPTLRVITNEQPGEFVFGRGEALFTEQWPELSVTTRKEGQRVQRADFKVHPPDTRMDEPSLPQPERDAESTLSKYGKYRTDIMEEEQSRPLMEADTIQSNAQ